mmetsp:Transcript_3119/g.4612  ORF Transcript_3119/g.4612 Transcript_3119/m.4612 type:complete len:83 (-) Transcript_3119:17-265(-)
MSHSVCGAYSVVEEMFFESHAKENMPKRDVWSPKKNPINVFTSNTRIIGSKVELFVHSEKESAQKSKKYFEEQMPIENALPL